MKNKNSKIAYIAALSILIAACGSDSSEIPDGSMDTMATKKPKAKPKTKPDAGTDADDTIVAPAPDAMKGKDASGGAGGTGGNIGIGGQGGKMPTAEKPKEPSEWTFKDYMPPNDHYALFKTGDSYMIVFPISFSALPGCIGYGVPVESRQPTLSGTFIRPAIPTDEARYSYEGKNKGKSLVPEFFLENTYYKEATLIRLFSQAKASGCKLSENT